MLPYLVCVVLRIEPRVHAKQVLRQPLEVMFDGQQDPLQWRVYLWIGVSEPGRSMSVRKAVWKLGGRASGSRGRCVSGMGARQRYSL